MNVTIGSDPEVFLQDMHTGEIISAIGHVGGSKEHPVSVLRGAVQEDNVLAEFNIEPARTRNEFVTNIKTVMGQLRERVNPFDLAIITSHRFTKQHLMRSGRNALMFGCDPDYNAYTGEVNTPPSARTELRTAGGHIHVGYDNPSQERNMEIGRVLDLLLGVPSVLLDADRDRRSLYGKAGAIRHKPYGMEYRTLSNFWLTHTDTVKWVYDRSVEATTYQNLERGDAELIVQCINKSDTRTAERLVSKYNLVMP